MKIRFDRDEWLDAQADFREDWRGLWRNEQGVVAWLVTLAICLLKLGTTPLVLVNCCKVKMHADSNRNGRD